MQRPQHTRLPARQQRMQDKHSRSLSARLVPEGILRSGRCSQTALGTWLTMRQPQQLLQLLPLHMVGNRGQHQGRTGHLQPLMTHHQVCRTSSTSLQRSYPEFSYPMRSL